MLPLYGPLPPAEEDGRGGGGGAWPFGDAGLAGAAPVPPGTPPPPPRIQIDAGSPRWHRPGKSATVIWAGAASSRTAWWRRASVRLRRRLDASVCGSCAAGVARVHRRHRRLAQLLIGLTLILSLTTLLVLRATLSAGLENVNGPSSNTPVKQYSGVTSPDVEEDRAPQVLNPPQSEAASRDNPKSYPAATPSSKVPPSSEEKVAGGTKSQTGDATKRAQVVEYRRGQVRAAFRHAWNGYRTHAFGADELKPVSNEPVYTFNGWGGTVVDALDTMLLMGLDEEFAVARAFLQTLHFRDDLLRSTATQKAHEGWRLTEAARTFAQWSDKLARPAGPGAGDAGGQRGLDDVEGEAYLPIFETTIRYLGGFLAAFDLSGDPLLLAKAKELGTLLLPVYEQDTLPGGLYNPLTYCGVCFETKNKDSGSMKSYGHLGGGTVLSELGSVQLEYERLSALTSDQKYAQKTRALFKKMREMPTDMKGLYPDVVQRSGTSFSSSRISFGALSDSFYEVTSSLVYIISEI